MACTGNGVLLPLLFRHANHSRDKLIDKLFPLLAVLSKRPSLGSVEENVDYIIKELESSNISQ